MQPATHITVTRDDPWMVVRIEVGSRGTVTLHPAIPGATGHIEHQGDLSRGQIDSALGVFDDFNFRALPSGERMRIVSDGLRWMTMPEMAKGTRPTALRILDVWSIMLPARIANEDLGDYLELLNRHRVAGRSGLACLCVLSAIVWTTVSAIGYVMGSLLGRSKRGA